MRSNMSKIDEYSMPKENMDYGKEFDLAKEAALQIEKLQLGSEFGKEPEEFPDTEQSIRRLKKKRHNKKLIRKMGYAVAATVTIVTMGQAVVSENTMQELYTKRNIGVFNGYTSNGGLIKRRGGLYDYTGNRIAMDSADFSKKMVGANADIGRIAINSAGYSLFYLSGGGVVLYDSKGNILHMWEEKEGTSVSDCWLSDNNIVCIEYYDEDYKFNYTYYNLHGKELYTSGMLDLAFNNAVGGTSFREGTALCYDGKGIVRLSKNGEWEYLAKWPVVEDTYNLRSRFGGYGAEISPGDEEYTLQNVPSLLVDGLLEGYFLVMTDNVMKGRSSGYAMVDIKTGQMYPLMLQSPKDSEFQVSGALKGYSDNEGTMFHYGSIVCLNRPEDTLIDVLKHCNHQGEIIGCIAQYDEIYFEDYPYLAVKDGEKYFYIDTEGNIVSRSYKKVSTFNNLGYALIMDNLGDVYVINDQFKKLKKLEDVTDFRIEDTGETFDVDKKGSSFIFYYGP